MHTLTFHLFSMTIMTSDFTPNAFKHIMYLIYVASEHMKILKNLNSVRMQAMIAIHSLSEVNKVVTTSPDSTDKLLIIFIKNQPFYTKYIRLLFIVLESHKSGDMP